MAMSGVAYVRVRLLFVCLFVINVTGNGCRYRHETSLS